MITPTETSSSIVENLPHHPYKKYAVLRLYVLNHDVKQQHLKTMYKTQIHKHNQSLLNNAYPNSGFDLFIPENVEFKKLFENKLIDLGIQSEMTYYDLTTDDNLIEIENGNEPIGVPTPFYLYPRSSFSGTPLMLSNHTGIIDSGYRGNLMGAFRLLYFPEPNPFGILSVSYENKHLYLVEQYTRLLQICHPSLCPVFVEIVEHFSDLSTTQRGNGGFGSTGIVGASVK